MNNTIKVLALNDDNHGTCFATYGSYFSDAAQFMQERLLRPHDERYEVRMVYLCDEFPDEVWEAGLDRSFDMVACCYDPEHLVETNPERWNERRAAFDFLWEVCGKEGFWI